MAPRIFPTPLRQGDASEARERVLQETDRWLQDSGDLLEDNVVRPQFSIGEYINLLDRAHEAGRYSRDEVEQILDALDRAPSAAEAEEIMLREFYRHHDAA